MERKGQSFNYPRMPTEMQEATHSGFIAQPPASPPTYEQAIHTATTTTTTYPPVQVLPTASGNNGNNDAIQRPQMQQQQQQQQTAKPTAGTQYGATNMGGGGVGAHTYLPNASATSQPMVQQQPVVIIQQHAILPLGPEPTFVTCPACHVTKLTRIDYEPNARTHLMAAILCIVGLWCCVCLPYCAESCMSTNHYCGNCNKFLGTYNGGGF